MCDSLDYFQDVFVSCNVMFHGVWEFLLSEERLSGAVPGPALNAKSQEICRCWDVARPYNAELPMAVSCSWIILDDYITDGPFLGLNKTPATQTKVFDPFIDCCL